MLKICAPDNRYDDVEKYENVKNIKEFQYLKVEGGLRTKGYYKNSLINKPLVTIITVVYNGEKHLENTIHSVINQSYNNLEYIIVDGESSDRTIDIIRRYETSIDYWVSEKDDGIYDAMNKGIKLSKGLYVGLFT